MKILDLLLLTAMAIPAAMQGQIIVETDAYRWSGDSVIQGEYEAIAVSPYEITSTYHARPGYYMGIEPRWAVKNDLSRYPRLSTSNTMHQAIYNMGLDEMVNAVMPDTTLRTGAAWGGVWTRDISYSIILSMAYMQPEASMVSLRRKVDKLGRIIQDTGSGGAWPVSTDREIWAVAAYEVYKATGDRGWLEYIYPIIKRSLDDDYQVAMDSETGLVKGETSFIDWREQSYPKWMQTASIAESEALGTNLVHIRALTTLSEIAALMGDNEEAALYSNRAAGIARAVNDHLWLDDKGFYAMYLYGGDNLIANERVETLGEALAILWDVAPAQRARTITESNPNTPFGVGIFYPQIADMPPYHNNALWPWVASYWAMACAKAGNEPGVLEAIGSVVRPAALFCTNKENFILDNGDIATELNSSNMLWCLAGNIAITHKVIFGIDFQKDGVAFHPFVPRTLPQPMSLHGFKYRDATLDINLSGYGDRIKSFTLDGKEHKPFLPSTTKGHHTIDIVMDNSFNNDLDITRKNNAKAPLTPLAWIEGETLNWNPVHDIDRYIIVKNGAPIDTVTTVTYDITAPGEYQVIAVFPDGTESFASQPRSNRLQLTFKPAGPLATEIQSAEIRYTPTAPVVGYTGQGFAESDHSTGAINIPITVPSEGDYTLRLRYSNGNGSVYTESSAAVRTVSLDGTKAGTIVMPHRGDNNWNDWGISTGVKVHLTPGTHMLSLSIEPCDENMDINCNHSLIDCVTVTAM
ncbi:MAG: hypothetical protein NC082_05795 [Clostridiales bacterium]|nr:hypothetical protein [Clostridiales bacterium]